MNVALHKTGSYQPLDSVNVQFFYIPDNGVNMYGRKTNSPDTTLNLSTVYALPSLTKFYMNWNIIRNNSIISTGKDSIPLVQFGTVNYTLNY